VSFHGEEMVRSSVLFFFFLFMETVYWQPSQTPACKERAQHDHRFSEYPWKKVAHYRPFVFLISDDALILGFQTFLSLKILFQPQ
jgi:hypothetical protein